jgi:dihydropteroate synthase
MEDWGATFIDVGGESTRPDSCEVDEEQELQRVIPVIEKLRKYLKPQTVISVDTTKARVAREAVAAGADMVNDISAGLFDASMLSTMASLNGKFS